jgi:NADH:ubiquinone oxidoreductase subunit 6 (subunit J)
MDNIFTVVIMIGALLGSVWFFVIFPAGLAEERNRSQVLWVTVAIVGTPLLATILLLILGEKKPKV